MMRLVIRTRLKGAIVILMTIAAIACVGTLITVLQQDSGHPQAESDAPLGIADKTAPSNDIPSSLLSDVPASDKVPQNTSANIMPSIEVQFEALRAWRTSPGQSDAAVKTKLLQRLHERYAIPPKYAEESSLRIGAQSYFKQRWSELWEKRLQAANDTELSLSALIGKWGELSGAEQLLLDDARTLGLDFNDAHPKFPTPDPRSPRIAESVLPHPEDAARLLLRSLLIPGDKEHLRAVIHYACRVSDQWENLPASRNAGMTVQTIWNWIAQTPGGNATMLLVEQVTNGACQASASAICVALLKGVAGRSSDNLSWSELHRLLEAAPTDAIATALREVGPELGRRYPQLGEYFLTEPLRNELRQSLAYAVADLEVVVFQIFQVSRNDPKYDNLRGELLSVYARRHRLPMNVDAAAWPTDEGSSVETRLAAIRVLEALLIQPADGELGSPELDRRNAPYLSALRSISESDADVALRDAAANMLRAYERSRAMAIDKRHDAQHKMMEQSRGEIADWRAKAARGHTSIASKGEREWIEERLSAEELLVTGYGFRSLAAHISEFHRLHDGRWPIDLATLPPTEFAAQMDTIVYFPIERPLTLDQVKTIIVAVAPNARAWTTVDRQRQWVFVLYGDRRTEVIPGPRFENVWSESNTRRSQLDLKVVDDDNLKELQRWLSASNARLQTRE